MASRAARHEVRERYLSFLKSIQDVALRPEIPREGGALEHALASEAAMARHFDALWEYMRFARTMLPGAVVLDAGCGAGELSLLLGMSGAQRVVALDFQSDCADFARWLTCDLAHLENVEVRCGDVGSLQMEEGELDAIFSIEAISHYRDPEAFLDMATSALRPGGLLFIRDGNNGASASVRVMNQEIWDFFEEHDEPGEIHGHAKGPTCYRSMRHCMIREAFPELSRPRVERYAAWTFGMSYGEIERAVPMFESGDTSMRSERADGLCPKDPLTDCAMERLFDPRALARELAHRGFQCRVISNGPARRDLALARTAWEFLSPLTILTPRSFSLVCRRDDC